MGGVCTCARADESEPPEQSKRRAEVMSAARVHTGDARSVSSERCNASSFAAALPEDVDSGEPPSSVGEVFHDAADEITPTDDTCGVGALASAPYAFARHAATWGVASERRASGDGDSKVTSQPPSRGAVTEGGADDDTADKPDDMRMMEKHAASFDDSFWGGSGGGSGALSVLKQLFHLRNMDLSRFSGVPISQHLPVSSAEVRPWLRCAADPF